MDLTDYYWDSGSGLWIDSVTGDTLTDAQYQAALADPGTAATAANAAATASSSSDWPTLSAIINALPSLATGLTSLELSQVNVQRAKTGLPPVNPATYGPQVNVGLASGTMNMVLIIALGIGAVLMMSKK